MRKEVLIAIVAGIAFGVVIAFGIWRANVALRPRPTSTENFTDQSTDGLDRTGFDLALASPQNNDVITQTPVQMNGITKEGSLVVVSSEDEDFVVNTQNGEFTQSVDLSGGLNQIIIHSYNSEGNVAKENLNLIFSTQFEPAAPSEEEKETSESSKEADLVRQKVREKLIEAQNKPKSYLGTITDIAEDTIQMKSESGEILQLTIGSDTAYVQLGKTSKDLTFEDVAIGDYIIALGYVDENNVLDSLRVLVTDALSAPTRNISYGNVVNIENKTLTLETSSGSVEAVFPKRWKGPEMSEVEDGDTVIIVTILDEGKETIRTIKILD